MVPGPGPGCWGRVPPSHGAAVAAPKLPPSFPAALTPPPPTSYQPACNRQVGEAELRELLEALDIRHEGVIQYDEFLAGGCCHVAVLL